MKLTTALLLFFTLNVSAKGWGQEKVNLRVKKAEIAGVLKSIELQTNYRFLYNNSLDAIREKVSLSVKDASISEVLTMVLLKTRLQYQIMDNNLIVIKEDPNAPVEVPDVTIRGTILGENNTPLAGASVQVKGATVGTTTNNEGGFSLTVADANVTLIISSVGYETQEIALAGKTEISLTLLPSTKEIEQVVVVGYGTQRKLDVTGSVGQIKGDEIAKQSSINPISALQGKIAGVQITNNGAPGASPQIRIRGLGTISGNPNPLYVVDGVWFDDISFLNPADIENLSVLKDASAQSIYGIRAANGVVLITTRKGRSGAPVVSYNGYVGYQTISNPIKMANANEYATLVNELSGAQTLNPASFGEGTDWYGQILRDALITNHQVGISGGSDKSTFNLSIGYLKQDGLVKGNSYDRYTAKFQNDYTLSRALKMGYTMTAAASNSKDIPGAIFRQIYTAYPVLPVYYADGSYGDPGDYPLGDGAKYNPQVTLDFFDQRSKNYRLTGNAFAELKFLRNFTLRSSIGGEFGQAEVRGYTPVYAATLNQRNTISSLTVSRGETRNWILENTLTYDNKFGDHSLRVLAGQGAQQYRGYNFFASAQNVPNRSSGDRYLVLGDQPTRQVSDGGSLRTTTSYFGRINYSFQNKYLLNASIRADAVSQFYGSDLWGYFPSVGAGWVISQESFMQNQNIFNNLKLRGSWGQIGNANVPINPTTSTISQTDYYSSFLGNGVQTGAALDLIFPPTIVWERSVGTDIGLEASMLNSRLTVELDFYDRKTKNAIFSIPVLSSIGAFNNDLNGNQASIQNRGFEFTAGWRGNISSDLTYNINANFSLNKNKITDVLSGSNPLYGGGNASTGGALATRTILGQPIGQFYGYQVIGIFQTAAEVAASAQPTAKPGDFRYRDVTGTEGKPDGKIDGLDRMAIGNPNPKYAFGLNTVFNYKQFDLTVDIQGVAGVDVYNANLGLRYGNENFTKDFYDNRWHGAGTSNEYPSANIGGGTNYLPNDFFVENGSYVRFRNLQLGYNFTGGIIDRAKIKNARVFVNAQNALNFFSYRGFSPEVSSGNPLNSGIDANVYPLYSTYNLGVNITF